MESEESFILRNYDWLMIVALLFGIGVTAYMQWIDRKRQKEMEKGVPNSKGIFIIYLLVTFMPVILMAVIHIVLVKLGNEPDSMFSYVPFILISSIGSIFIFNSPLKGAQVKAKDRFWVYFFLVLGCIAPMTVFINMYRPLTQPVKVLESVDRINTLHTSQDFFYVRAFVPRIDKLHDRITTSKGKKSKMYYLGLVPLAVSPLDTVYSTWVMIDKSKAVEGPVTEIDIAEFMEKSRAIVKDYPYDSIKFFKKHHRSNYNYFLRKSGMIKEPLLIVTPFTYTLSRYIRDDVYLFIGIYLFCTTGFMVFAKFGSSTDSE